MPEQRTIPAGEIAKFPPSRNAPIASSSFRQWACSFVRSSNSAACFGSAPVYGLTTATRRPRDSHGFRLTRFSNPRF